MGANATTGNQIVEVTGTVTTAAQVGTWSAPVAANVTTSATQIVGANAGRKNIIITNDSTNILYLGKDNTVTATSTTKGIAVAANGGSFSTNYTGAIYGIYGTGSNTVGYIEES